MIRQLQLIRIPKTYRLHPHQALKTYRRGLTRSQTRYHLSHLAQEPAVRASVSHSLSFPLLRALRTMKSCAITRERETSRRMRAATKVFPILILKSRLRKRKMKKTRKKRHQCLTLVMTKLHSSLPIGCSLVHSPLRTQIQTRVWQRRLVRYSLFNI